MKFNRIALPALALTVALSGLAIAQKYGGPQRPPTREYSQIRGDWDSPPQEFRDIQRRGFHDGIEGARRDFENHRRPNVNNRDEFRHPHVDPSARQDYREGFRRGYDRAMSHLLDESGPR